MSADLAQKPGRHDRACQEISTTIPIDQGFGSASFEKVVSQAFCSALPVSYNPHIPSVHWKAFALLVLEAAYEATMWQRS